MYFQDHSDFSKPMLIQFDMTPDNIGKSLIYYNKKIFVRNSFESVQNIIYLGRYVYYEVIFADESSVFPSYSARVSEDSDLQSSFNIQLSDCGDDLVCKPWLVMRLEPLKRFVDLSTVKL